jgi:chemotaxis protein MotB
MMALFLCLWLTSQDQKIKDAVERAFRNPFSSVTKESVGIIPNKEHSSAYKQEGKFTSISAVEMETMRHLSDDLSKLLKEKDQDQTSVDIQMTGDGLMINIFDRSKKPIFEADSDTFTDYGSWVFSTLAWEVARYTTFRIFDRSKKPVFEADSDTFTDYGSWVFSTLAWEVARYTTFRIELEGHTEKNDQSGRETHSKWELSTERANAARRKLVTSGVTSDQICKVSGYADTAPMLGYLETDEVNRRVTVMLKLKESADSTAAAAAADAKELPHDRLAN